MTVRIVRKSITLPEFLSDRLEQVSNSTGFSASNLIQQGLAAFLYRFEDQEETESMECWLERLGRTSGLYESDHNMTSDLEGEIPI